MSKTVVMKNVSKSFDRGTVKALLDISFSLKKGQIVSVIGESGSGKTTLVRLIAGLEAPDSGSIFLNDKLMSSEDVFIAPEKRKVGMLFQDYALFPHMSVFENIAYGIAKKINKNERINQMLEIVDLKGFEKRYPHELSGGQQQRVAMARALAPDPELLILDEPFSNLDVILKNQLRKEIAEILKLTNKTAIFITHDIKDAIVVSDKIMVLQNGLKIQQGSVKEMYNNPKNEYVKLLFEEQLISKF